MNATIPQDQLELGLYFQRIGFTAEAKPTLSSLKHLHRLHEESIPFENLDPLLNRPVSIDPPDVFEKLVAQKRGGYCFEQNTLFAAVLRAIGFRVDPLLARVSWLAPEDVTTPLSHMVLRVETEFGPHLADVGFGGVGLVEPIALDTSETQHLDFEPRRIIQRDEQLVHQIKLSDDWNDIYQLSPKPVPPIDLEIGNWYSHTHPQARFRNSLLVARLTKTGRIVVADTELIERDWSGNAKRTEIKSQSELRQILSDRFDLELSPEDRIVLAGKPLKN
ncbi:arylamine N-acetyltransferase [Pelagicoccus sp. SDUM812002]|uniref:arylamine N-acetyltransferase family protein n=1 Tax=Pelagicoccus sp. SDUM812002 TaxID=3041266 RepID=UPI00280FD1DB|nr:arylamine N-acetyltransferase [Pelagicoccus sp. SDUM812002]MDQ8187052.1 arylamine N-acetyltransferase [Pelagicoccus sp. SDUM812002]